MMGGEFNAPGHPESSGGIADAGGARGEDLVVDPNADIVHDKGRVPPQLRTPTTDSTGTRVSDSSRQCASPAHLKLFQAIEAAGEVVVAVGPPGSTANIVGVTRVRRHEGEHYLDVNDGAHLFLVAWNRVRRAEVRVHDGEGLIEFFDGDVPLFRVYRIAGPFSQDVELRARSIGV